MSNHIIRLCGSSPIILSSASDSTSPQKQLRFDAWIEKQERTTWLIVSEQDTGDPTEIIVYLISSVPNPETLFRVEKRLSSCQYADTFIMAIKQLKEDPDFGFIDIVFENKSSLESSEKIF